MLAVKWSKIDVRVKAPVEFCHNYVCTAEDLEKKIKLEVEVTARDLMSATVLALKAANIQGVRLSDFTFNGGDIALWRSSDGVISAKEKEIEQFITKMVNQFKMIGQQELINSLMRRYRQAGELGLIEYLFTYALQAKDFPRS